MSLPVQQLIDSYQELVAPGNDPRFFRLLNEAESRLLETAKWNWTQTEVELTVDAGCVYIDPAVHKALLGAQVGGSRTGRIIRPRGTEFAAEVGYHTDAGAGGTGYLVDQGIISLTIDDEPARRRKYKIVDLTEDGDTVIGFAHLAHITLTSEDDYTLCPSSRALKLAMYACLYEEANDLERAKNFWAESYAALSEDEASHRGGIRAQVPIQPSGEGISPISALT